ncbi:LOW QUALITY PROTEIN: centrosomal protein kizuna [Melanotaenia boesemani]|uniref:LOW QUALITY PROTEIN: centrosomal protein kizuna n=1 Tax=Melanotaenia boesemani TaxID=1250792 RepID=UPI001C03AED6|nr:LOW QUALITY PROTEIN: centrosomal protein kizuna [Melanotaenia boesemani]
MVTTVNHPSSSPSSSFFLSRLSGSAKRAIMDSLGRTEDKYYEKIKAIQQSMSKREKRRMELERELFAYSRSDIRISQIKCSKLHSYLKEICDREARAKMRNLELQRNVECIEISMKEYSPDHGPLQQQKAEFLKNISRFIEARKKMEPKMEAAKVESMQRQYQEINISHTVKDFTQSPMEIFMEHQTSRGSDAEAGTTSVHSHRALRRSPNRSVHSRERLPSGLLKDFRVGGEDAASKRTHLSDDISGSNDSPDGCNLSDKHERTLRLLPSVHALTGTAGSVAFGSDDEQEASPLVTLTGPEKNPSPSNSGSLRAKNSLAEHTDSQEVAHEPLIMGDEERGLGHLMPETTFGKEAQDMPGKCESISTLSSDVELSESSASDLTISLTQSELEEDLPEDVVPVRNSYRGKDDHKQHSPKSSIHSNGSKLHSESSGSAVTLKSLSLEGFYSLLDSIEGRLHGEQTHVYGDSSVDERQRNRIISLCDDGAGLNEEDLEACGAVVLHELQRLSWNTEKGCLLSQDLVYAHQYNTEPNKISTSLPPNAARLWDRWFKHALVLKEHRVLSTERLVQLFTPLLLKRHATYSQQAKVFLRTLLSRSSEECPSAEDVNDVSSLCRPPSLLPDKDVKPERSIQKPQIQELQSTEEDSQDESPVESGPIRETKAYQLLKQSAMQERLQSSEEEEEKSVFSGINHGHEEDLGRAKCSSHQDPYPRIRTSKAYSALQSKAFWQESDDSDSEIEAALRPPT